MITWEAGVHRFESSMVVPLSLLLHESVSMAPPRSFCLLVICSTTGRDTAFSGGGSGSSAPFQKRKNPQASVRLPLTQLPVPLSPVHTRVNHLLTLSPHQYTAVSQKRWCLHHENGITVCEENKDCVRLHLSLSVCIHPSQCMSSSWHDAWT